MTLAATGQLARRAREHNQSDKNRISSPQDVDNIPHPLMEQLKQEQLRVLDLDTRMRTLENVMVYQVTARRNSASGGSRQRAEHNRSSQPSQRRPTTQSRRHRRYQRHPGRRQTAGHRIAGPHRNRSQRPIRQYERKGTGLRMKPRPHTHIAKANSLRRERLRNQLAVRRAAKHEGRDIHTEPQNPGKSDGHAVHCQAENP